MCEILLIVLLGQNAVSKGRSFGWALLAPVCAYGGGFVALIFGVIAIPDLAGFLAIAGYLAGFAGAYVVVDGLQPAAGFAALGTAISVDCPACGSAQTDATGDAILCYACDAISYPD